MRSTSLSLTLAVLLTGAAILAPAAEAGRGDGRRSREMLRLEREIKVEDKDQIDVRIEFGAGQLRVLPGRQEGRILLDLRYPEDSEEPEIEYSEHGHIGELHLSCGDIHANWDDEDREDSEEDRERDLHVDGWWDDDDAPYEWTIRLPRGVTYTMELATGASKNEIDLSGLGVDRLEVSAGAGKLELRFDDPNPFHGGSLQIQGGACEINAIGLGNGNFRTVTLEGGLGDFSLDFRGRTEVDARAEIEIGLGRLNVRLPEDLGVKLDCGGRTLSGIDVHGMERQGDCYLSRKYGKADHEMVMEISSALGKVEVEVRD